MFHSFIYSFSLGVIEIPNLKTSDEEFSEIEDFIDQEENIDHSSSLYINDFLNDIDSKSSSKSLVRNDDLNAYFILNFVKMYYVFPNSFLYGQMLC